MHNLNLEIIIFALFGGMLPATLWLWFWLREDREHPEPKLLILMTFFAGSIAVPLVLPFQTFVYKNFAGSTLLTFILWAALEETFKYAAAYSVALRSKEMDEPIDAMIYLVTAALGFVALENTLFLIKPLITGNLVESIITGNLRFVGASLLHVICSATVGIFIAFSFHKSKKQRILYTIFGILCAIILHTCFNLSIIEENGSNTFIIFSVLWLTIATLLLFFEKIKKLVY
jgi:RsiW-degrading membrane proteinase PrsW (M82 family)